MLRLLKTLALCALTLAPATSAVAKTPEQVWAEWKTISASTPQENITAAANEILALAEKTRSGTAPASLFQRAMLQSFPTMACTAGKNKLLKGHQRNTRTMFAFINTHANTRAVQALKNNFRKDISYPAEDLLRQPNAQAFSCSSENVKAFVQWLQTPNGQKSIRLAKADMLKALGNRAIRGDKQAIQLLSWLARL